MSAVPKYGAIIDIFMFNFNKICRWKRLSTRQVVLQNMEGKNRDEFRQITTVTVLHHNDREIGKASDKLLIVDSTKVLKRK